VQEVRLGDVRRILVLNRNHIGDCLLTTPLLRALKRRFPRARLEVSIPKTNWELLATNSHVDEIVLRPQIPSWGAKFQFAFEMRRRGYDLILALQDKSMFYAWTTCYIGLANRRRPVTVALDHPRTRAYYDHNVAPMRPDQHEVYKYLDIASALGCPRERNPVLELEATAESRERMERLIHSRGLDSDARFVGINPGATKGEKRWSVERFAEVGDRLHQELGLPVIIFGGPGDHEMASAIVRGMSHQPLVAAGRTSLGDTAALLERCQFLVTGDTGPMHMAVAMAVPVVALFGPTNPAKFGPFTRLKTILRHDEPCPSCTSRCLHTITPDEVVQASLKLYQAPPPRVGMDRRQERK
jgi:lipopolysaccharide heptosyltransferase II